jgi:hypothetical protein
MGQNNWGVGVRLGDPSGISIKKYTQNNAIELNVGRTHLTGRDRWYDNRFDDWYKDKKFGHKDFQYNGYKASTPIGVQLHYLFRKSINNVAEESVRGLEWYYGIGGQFRYQTYSYDYRYKLDGDPNWYYNTGDRVADIDIGIDGVLGLEYTFDEAPISIFLDATLFMEVVDDPFYFWLQGGIGVRYNF